MKFITHPRFLALATVLAVAGAGVWLDRRETPIREGRIALDAAFLKRLGTEDLKTTRDPAIKALSTSLEDDDMPESALIASSITVDVHRLGRDLVEVTVEIVRPNGNMRSTKRTYSHHRAGWREVLSMAFWKDSFHEGEYWKKQPIDKIRLRILD